MAQKKRNSQSNMQPITIFVMREDKPKKPLYKKWWFWLIVVLVVGSILATTTEKKESSPTVTSTPVPTIITTIDPSSEAVTPASSIGN